MAATATEETRRIAGVTVREPIVSVEDLRPTTQVNAVAIALTLEAREVDAVEKRACVLVDERRQQRKRIGRIQEFVQRWKYQEEQIVEGVEYGGKQWERQFEGEQG